VADGWDFSVASDYHFDADFIDIASGRAQLKVVDTGADKGKF
jgi:hypothetical protein